MKDHVTLKLSNNKASKTKKRNLTQKKRDLIDVIEEMENEDEDEDEEEDLEGDEKNDNNMPKLDDAIFEEENDIDDFYGKLYSKDVIKNRKGQKITITGPPDPIEDNIND